MCKLRNYVETYALYLAHWAWQDEGKRDEREKNQCNIHDMYGAYDGSSIVNIH